ncbi:MAG: TolC family protein, partial [Desulfobacula sp.]|nr:TolC family protein [Desulfobacula sp.]
LRILHIHITLLFLLLWPVCCSPLELTLHEAVKLALENNSEVRMNILELDIKKSEIKRKLAQYIPTFNLDSSYTYAENKDKKSKLSGRHFPKNPFGRRTFIVC